MNQKTNKSLRGLICLVLLFVIFSSMLFFNMMMVVTSALVFDEWNEENPDEQIEGWVLHFYYNMIFIWLLSLSLVAIFIVYRFIWYPEIIFTEEVKEKCFGKKLLKKKK